MIKRIRLTTNEEYKIDGEIAEFKSKYLVSDKKIISLQENNEAGIFNIIIYYSDKC